MYGQVSTKLEKLVTYSNFFKSFRAMAAVLSLVLAMVVMMFSESYLSVYLIEKIVVSENPFLDDKASGLFNAAYGLGNFISPILGSVIAEVF